MGLQACGQAAVLLYRAQQQQQSGQSAQGLLLQALHLYQQANQANPQLVFPYLGLAYVLFSQGKRVAAQKALDTALALEPSSAAVIGFKALLAQNLSAKETGAASLPQALIPWQQESSREPVPPLTALERITQPLKGMFADAQALQEAGQQLMGISLSDADSQLLWCAIEEVYTATEALTVLKSLAPRLGAYDLRYQYQPGLLMKQLAAYNR